MAPASCCGNDTGPAVRFFTCNLAAPVMPLGAARYDVILCRNMLIYFG
jgi:chemotaxis methyl-accepting protein methylase